MNIKPYTLSIPNEIEITFLNYGGIIQHIFVPDGKGKSGDVVLGFDDPEAYLQNGPYFGAIIGRYANRIANGVYKVQGKNFKLSQNEGTNSLHGGTKGLDRVFWTIEKTSPLSCTLFYTSPHLDQGHPGELRVEITYSITQKRELIIDYKASTDQETHINLTNHSYFNLSGIESKTILDHELWIDADKWTTVNDQLIPTGEIAEVDRMNDFRVPRKISQVIPEKINGLDLNYVLNKCDENKANAYLIDRNSGIKMDIFTTEPGLQLYSGHSLDGSVRGKKGIWYQKYHGLCLETQHFPDSPHHPHFPTTLLEPQQKFTSRTTYKFSNF